MRRIFVLSVAFTIASTLVAAQPVAIDRAQVSAVAARKMVDGCVAWAARNKAAVAVAVVDIGGVPIDVHAMDGTGGTASLTALLKARTAAHWRRSTQILAQDVASGRNQASLWVHDFPRPGGQPILIGGQVAGAVGVGGGHGDEDDMCALAGIEAVLGKQPAPVAH